MDHQCMSATLLSPGTLGKIKLFKKYKSETLENNNNLQIECGDLSKTHGTDAWQSSAVTSGSYTELKGRRTVR